MQVVQTLFIELSYDTFWGLLNLGVLFSEKWQAIHIYNLIIIMLPNLHIDLHEPDADDLNPDESDRLDRLKVSILPFYANRDKAINLFSSHIQRSWQSRW